MKLPKPIRFVFLIAISPLILIYWLFILWPYEITKEAYDSFD